MTHLKPGDKAPELTGKDQQSNPVSLSDYAGQKLIISFYPRDNTPGCTAEWCNLRDNLGSLQKKGFQVLGVSTDSAKSHNKFIKKYELPYRLLADEDKAVVTNYGVWGKKKFMGIERDGTHRTTFIIDEKGAIEHIIDKVKTKDHAAQILELYD